jgi:hypothetical protein
MTDKAVWDKEIPVPASLIAYVDDAVIASELGQPGAG